MTHKPEDLLDENFCSILRHSGSSEPASNRPGKLGIEREISNSSLLVQAATWTNPMPRDVILLRGG